MALAQDTSCWSMQIAVGDMLIIAGLCRDPGAHAGLQGGSGRNESIDTLPETRSFTD